MINPLISIIIPVYNVEKYLKECLNSVINQTYTNLEIILVDDGSTDSSGQMCDEFAKKDNRIKVIHKQNGGLSSARNAGLDVMSGEYLAFVDSDDMVDEAYIATLFDLIKKYDTKIAMCYFQKFKNTKDIENFKNLDCKYFVLSSEEVFKYTFSFHSMFMTVVWTNLYHKEIFANLRFSEGILFEYTDIYYEIVEQQNINKTIAVTNKKLYFYRQQESSIMKTFNEKKLHRINIATKFANKVENRYKNLEKYCNFYKANIALNSFDEIKRQQDDKFGKYLEELRSIIKKNFNFISALKINFKRALIVSLFIVSEKLYFYIKYKVKNVK